MMTFDEQWEAHKGDGGKYQALLGELVLEHAPATMVETGGGYSSLFILKAMDERQMGHLITIDPDTQVKFTHPRWTWIQDVSQNALGPLYVKTGPWDAFLHDSDHEVWCQTFEYACALAMVRPGGWIISDDYEWGNPIHWAWKDFMARNELENKKMGSAMMARKPHLLPILSKEHVGEYVDLCREMADEAKRDWDRLRGVLPR